MSSPVGVFLANTVTIEASGYAWVSGGFSTEPFENLTITIKPLDHTTNYTVDVYHDGELEESHDYPDPPSSASVIAHMMYPNMIFPPNMNTGNLPVFFDPSRENPAGVGISIRLYNSSSTRKTFYVYVCFKEYDDNRAGKLTILS